jgi:hypothetical protein
MLRFSVFIDGKPAKAINLEGAYLVGSDGVPVRAEIEFKRGEILCRKRSGGPTALWLLWPVDGGGRLMLETTRLPEREKPYILQLELLRGRLMRVAQKREDWGLHDFEGTDAIAAQINEARDYLLKGLTAATPADAAAFAEKGIRVSLAAAEDLTAFHAEIFLNRRKQVGEIPPRLLGCTIDVTSRSAPYRKRLLDAFEYIAVPFTWRDLEPKDKEFNWEPFDNWVEWAVANKIPIRGSNLVSFSPTSIPDWLYIWEHDFEAVRDLVYEHIRRVIGRYGKHIQIWDVISGVHAHNCFSFNFEQLMELTRMTAAVTKQLAPRSTAVVDLVLPWGEYYAVNQRTIPPMLYAEMIVQSGVNFDAFGLQCCFGVAAEGMYVRDIFQISSMLDRFAVMGKPLHLTGIQVPSATTSDPRDAWGGKRGIAAAGAWHGDWSEEVQKEWLRRVYNVAMSKPFIEVITWRDLGDTGCHHIPHGGLLKPDAAPKSAFHEMLAIRKGISQECRRASHPANR